MVDLVCWVQVVVEEISYVVYLSLLVLEADRMLRGLSSSGISSMGVSRERREAWECDPASEAIRSASLRASWASWKYTHIETVLSCKSEAPALQFQLAEGVSGRTSCRS